MTAQCIILMQYYDKRISVIKAICIILMVVGHSGAPGALNNILYLFHMPCFFFISGFLLKDKYLDDMLHFSSEKLKAIGYRLSSGHLFFYSYTMCSIIYIFMELNMEELNTLINFFIF